VEEGVAPEMLIAHRGEGEKGDRTRPLCPYPQVAVYDGKGNINEATSFRCSVGSGRANFSD
jgi:feruloyl esterase